jgi:type IV fimbrial biogenesis protein FimT
MRRRAFKPLDPAQTWVALPRRIDYALDRGMTLIEAMIVIAMLGILLASAVPSFARLLSAHRASTTTNDLVHAIALARSEAMKRGHRVYLAPTSGRWRDGWAVFIDRNDNRLFDPSSSATPDELIAQHDALPASIAITNPTSPSREPFTDVGSPQRTYVMFDGTGYARQRNGGLLLGSLTVTDTSGSIVTLRTICLASYGRVRIVVDRATCS